MSQYPSNSARIEAAMRFAAEGRREQARALLMEVVRADPNNATAWANLAQIVEDRERAIYCWQQVLRIDPGNIQATRQIAQLQRGGFTPPSARTAGGTAGQRAVMGARRRRLSALAVIGAILAGLSVALLALLLGGVGGSGGLLFLAPSATPGRQIAEAGKTARPTRTLPPPRTPGERPTATASPTVGDTPTPLPSQSPLPTWTPENTATARPPHVAQQPVVRFVEPLPTPTPWPFVHSLSVHSQTQYYYFGGASVFEIERALLLHSQDFANGDVHSIATTQTQFRLETQLVQSGQTCVVPSFTVYLDLTYTYPQWQPASAPDPAVLAEWQRFIAYVVDHEERHGEIAFQCAVELVEDIRALQPSGDCQQTRTTYDQMVNRVTSACQQRQAEFDRNQGAVTFPLSGSGAVPSMTATQTGTPGTATPAAGAP